MRKRLKAFTIIELIMSLLISSVVISIVFYVYLFFNKQFLRYQDRSKQVNEYFLFKKALQDDMDRAARVDRLSPADIVCLGGAAGDVIYYSFSDSMMIRRHLEAADTFRIRNQVVYAGNQADETAGEPVNKVILRLLVAGSVVDAFFVKRYSAHQLMKQAGTDE